MSKPTRDMERLFRRGKNDPAFFVENVVGTTTLWHKQIEIANSVRDNFRTAVRSCNGAGKTFISAAIVAWFLTSHVNSIVISTAPTSRQVRELLWQEINNIKVNSNYPLGGETTLVQWTLGPKWFALGLSTDDPNRFQGFHAEHILGVIDEAAGVDSPIWEAMDAILTSYGARLLVIGNPTEPSGEFFNAFSSPLYNKIHISAFDTPNFTDFGITEEDIANDTWQEKITGDFRYPALITPKWVAERRIEWGEDSPAYQARVKGNFPLIGTDTMIPLGWVLRAKERPCVYNDDDDCFMAVDVARYGDDDSVIGIRRGNSLTRKEVFHHADVHALSKAAKFIADEEHPKWIKVDVVGIGAGVADNLRAWGYPAVDYVAQGRAWNADKFVNRRTESWYLTREKFRKDLINIPPDDVLIGQLTATKYDFDVAGRYRLESKDKIKARGLPSPDHADVVVMLFEAEDAYESFVHSDVPLREDFPKGSVGDMLRILEEGESEEARWQALRL